MAKERKFYINTLSGENLLKHYKVDIDNGGNYYIHYTFNYDDMRERRRFVKSMDLYNDCALFYQIQQVLSKEKIDNEWNKILLQAILFVDFESVFVKDVDKGGSKDIGQTCSEEELAPKSTVINNNYRLWELFQRGIDVEYAGNHKVHYIPFDKSNSMARSSKISFIDESLVAELNKRLNLDIPFGNHNVQLSKYYAYRGLYLSTAVRALSDKELLNSSTVIIIKDNFTCLGKQAIFTAEETVAESNVWKTKYATKNVDIAKVYDGEGIISPTLAKKINEVCGFKDANSFQVRMPFVKGMLHQVDFHSFIKEAAGDVVEFLVEDAFGVKRDLLKAEIVMPVSMFKCFSWIKYAVNTAKDVRKIMDYYFQKFYDYDHALYISNTSLIYGDSSITKLNYQFLNTLALSYKEFDELVKRHLNYVRNPLEYILKDNRLFANSKKYINEEDSGEIEKREDEGTRATWKQALMLNPNFAREHKIKNIIEGQIEGLKLDCARGKLIVNGEIRYLSRDLLGFLINLVKPNLKPASIRELMRKCMFVDEFFMPKPQIKLDITKHYPIFRNPHLSRNEQCVLKPYLKAKGKRANDLYYRYFGHLNSILMVGYKSLVPNALGGADFDGDIVKIIDEDCIRNAVLRGVYKNYKERRDDQPIIDIPSKKGRGNLVKDTVDYLTIKNTFSNKIGQISNLSIKLGAFQYGAGRDDLEHTCAECTILTGLEIDAAKTGSHPELDEVISYSKGLNVGYDYVTKFKNIIDELSSSNIHVTKKNIDVDETSYYIKEWENAPVAVVAYTYDENFCNLNKIPKYYIESIGINPELPGEKKNCKCFDFEYEKAWEKKLDQGLMSKAKAIIEAYNRVCTIASKVYNKRKKIASEREYEGHIKTILRLQYDNGECEELVTEALVQLEANVDSLLDTKEKVEEALSRLKDSDWPFLLPNEREAMLTNILGVGQEQNIVALLTNFESRGYSLLFYILKDVLNLREREASVTSLIDSIHEELEASDKNPSKVDAELYQSCYRELYEMYKHCADAANSNWKRELQARCRDKFRVIFKEIDEDQKCKIGWALRNVDRNGILFWDSVSIRFLKDNCTKVKESDYAE